jgi:hypothetical protein
LAKLLEKTKEKVDGHESGRRLLSDEDYALHAKRIGLYGKKLEQMNQPMSDEVRMTKQTNAGLWYSPRSF